MNPSKFKKGSVVLVQYERDEDGKITSELGTVMSDRDVGGFYDVAERDIKTGEVVTLKVHEDIMSHYRPVGAGRIA